MTWEETIQFIRTQPEYKDLVEKAYFEEDIALNIERFKVSEEYRETLALIKKYQPTAKRILDIGCGNGISSIALALSGYEVVAVEPDPSETIGAGAIRKMKSHYNLDNIEIHEAFAEDIAFPTGSFDIVYVRQAMHHANDLEKFIGEAGRVLKPGGALLTIRDHVVFDKQDKEWFLEKHSLQKFYGGENAFSPTEYKAAMTKAGLTVVLELKYYDSIINYFPVGKEHVEKLKQRKQIFSWLGPLKKIVPNKITQRVDSSLDEMKVPGRMYSYVAQKTRT